MAHTIRNKQQFPIVAYIKWWSLRAAIAYFYIPSGILPLIIQNKKYFKFKNSRSMFKWHVEYSIIHDSRFVLSVRWIVIT